MIVGVDNGSCSGAMVALTDDGEVLGYTRLPAYKPKKQPKELVLEEFVEWVKMWEEPVSLVAVERPLTFSRSVQAMRSMALCYGQIQGLCAGLGWRHEGIDVRAWQNAMLGYFPKGQSKRAALRKARQLAPSEKWCSSRGNKPHDGIVDAYLIGMYALEKKI
jgi:hypothetical protein